ncbi:hypothetical protein XPA_009615 [Xanthoria parietina]
MIALPAAALSLLLLTATASLLNIYLDKRQSDMLSTINGWRHTLGASPLSWSQDMANAAANTGRLNGGGVSMNSPSRQRRRRGDLPRQRFGHGSELEGSVALVDTNRQDAVMKM